MAACGQPVHSLLTVPQDSPLTDLSLLPEQDAKHLRHEGTSPPIPHHAAQRLVRTSPQGGGQAQSCPCWLLRLVVCCPLITGLAVPGPRTHRREGLSPGLHLALIHGMAVPRAL